MPQQLSASCRFSSTHIPASVLPYLLYWFNNVRSASSHTACTESAVWYSLSRPGWLTNCSSIMLYQPSLMSVWPLPTLLDQALLWKSCYHTAWTRLMHHPTFLHPIHNACEIIYLWTRDSSCATILLNALQKSMWINPYSILWTGDFKDHLYYNAAAVLRGPLYSKITQRARKMHPWPWSYKCHGSRCAKVFEWRVHKQYFQMVFQSRRPWGVCWLSYSASTRLHFSHKIRDA
jgi:hypothetical protein